ncbi:MAG: PEP-CTERM sorting domain-containing protein [Luteolibacter sp.]
MKTPLAGLIAVCSLAATATSVSAQTYSYDVFDLNNAVVTGTPNAVNSKYTYIGADPGGLYDVVVTLVSQSTTSSIFSNPQADATSGFIDSYNVTGADSFFTPSWNLLDTSVVGNFTASMTFQFSVFNTGTSIAAPLNLYAITLDNDGDPSASAPVHEQVLYGGSPDILSYGSKQNRNGNQFTASTTEVHPGITTDPAFRVDALYRNTSSFTWTASHLVNDLSTVDSNKTRISALQLGYTTVPEPSAPLMLIGGVGVLLLIRRRS